MILFHAHLKYFKRIQRLTVSLYQFPEDILFLARIRINIQKKKKLSDIASKILNIKYMQPNQLTITEHLVRLANLVKFLCVDVHFVGVFHGMVLQGELFEVGLYLLLCGYALNLQHVVVVLLCWEVRHIFCVLNYNFKLAVIYFNIPKFNNNNYKFYGFFSKFDLNSLNEL